MTSFPPRYRCSENDRWLQLRRISRLRLTARWIVLGLGIAAFLALILLQLARHG